MKGQGLWMAVLAIALVAILGFLAYNQFTPDAPQTVVGGSGAPSSGSCALASPLTVAPRSADPFGAAYSSPTITCGYGGESDAVLTTSVTSGTTTFIPGRQVTCLISKADYLDDVFTFEHTCGGTNLDAPLWSSTSDNPAITIKDPDNAGATLDDAIGGGAVNLTNPSAGSTVKFDVFFEGTSGESSGEGIYVIEFPAGSSANITDVTMGNLQKVSLPQVHTSQNAGSKVYAFEVPAVENAVEPDYRVIVTLTAGKDLSGGVYTDFYSKQWAVDDDSTAIYGVEDSDGTAIYENTGDKDFYIA